MSDTGSRLTRYAALGASALVTSMLVPALAAPADAATPKARATYQGTVKFASAPVEITFKFGPSTRIMKKITIKSDCGDVLPSEKLVLKKVLVEDNGKFYDYIYDPSGHEGISVKGQFVTKNKVTGTASADICYQTGIDGDFTARA